MVFDLTSTNAKAAAACVRQGALFAPNGGVHLDRRKRHVWMRPLVYEAIYGKNGSEPTHWAAEDVQAFIRRYIQGLGMIIVQNDDALSTYPDFKPTQGSGLTVFEVRFDLDPHEPSQFRLFGRFIDTDAFVITSYGEKGKDKEGKEKKIVVSQERLKCQKAFEMCGFSGLIPTIKQSLTNVRISS